MNRPIHPLLSALTAAALAAAVACGPGASAPPASATAAPSSASPGPSTLVWQRVASFPVAPDGSAVTDVAAAGPGIVAVGFDGGTRALVWTSADGRAWTAVPHGAVFEDGLMTGVATKGRRIVAVGRDVTSIERDAVAAWLSDDGIAWRRAVVEDPEGGQMIRVVAGGPGFIAVGSSVGRDSAAVWTSADGERWTRAPHEPALDHAFMWDVASAPGGYLAVGWRRMPTPSAAVWQSPDGVRWSLAPDLADATGLEIRAVLALRDRVVAAGSRIETGGAATWTSLDGRRWMRSVGGPFESASITTLLQWDGGVLALGGRGVAAGAWSSRDGSAWTTSEDPMLEDAYFTSGALAGGRLVAVGATQRRIPGTGSFEQRAAVWLGTPR